jgi:6-phosphogluconate dehydrogenase (decarboxylating)
MMHSIKVGPPPGGENGGSRAERGYIHAGPSGAGHFVKMVHNGIEYGMMQAYAEGFDILRNKDSKDPRRQRLALEYKISRILCDARILSIVEGAAETAAIEPRTHSPRSEGP